MPKDWRDMCRRTDVEPEEVRSEHTMCHCRSYPAVVVVTDSTAEPIVKDQPMCTRCLSRTIGAAVVCRQDGTLPITIGSPKEAI